MESLMTKKETSSFDEMELQQIVIPLKQMIHEDDDEEENCLGETGTCLTGRVRVCYLNHLEKTLLKNYEICCDKGSAQWHLSPEDVVRCAVQLEQKALRSCMVVILYQRAMTRLASDIKKHTEQLKLYRKLKDYVTTHHVWSDKTTQTGEHVDCIDKTTQTVFTGTNAASVESCDFQTETRIHTSKSIPADHCFQPSTVKTEPPTPEGAPIPVYVSGINDIGVRNTDYYHINGIEPIPRHDMNQEFVVDVHADSLCQYPILSTETPFLVNCDGDVTDKLTSKQDIQEEEPYEWSVIEEQTRSNVKINAASPETLLGMRRLSNLQQNGNLSNGMLHDKVSDLFQEEHPYMSIDDRISSVLNNEAHRFPYDEQLHGKTVSDKDTEPNMWTIEKYHQQKLLRAKILDTCCDVRKRGRMRCRFLELFGSDSEDCFDVDECVTNFKEKIARWVVENLMPFYREGRIQSRPLFKFLARHIADTLLLKNQMPVGILMPTSLLTADSRQHAAADRRKHNPTSFNIGGVLSNKESMMFFKQTISNLNFHSQYVTKGITYDSIAIAMDHNPIRTALRVCNDLINQSVYAVVVSHPLTGDLSPAAVSYTSGFYHIPVIGISSRDSAFSDKNIHVSFLRTVPPYSHQADVWVELLKHLGYRKVIFIHSSDTDGRALLGRFQSTSQSLEDDVEMKVQVESVIEFEPGLDGFTDQLLEVKNAQSRVYMLYAGEADARVIFQEASLLNMTGKDYAWIVTEQALEAPNVPTGILGLKLVNATSEESHIKDSIYVLASALKQMNQTEVITEAPKDCGNTGQIWETGKALFEYIKKQSVNGSTGNVAFDDNGDRINAEYDIINVQNQTQISVGQYHYSYEQKRMKLILDKSAIIWPGNTDKQPPGFMIPTHLKVLTIEEKPFVYVREIQTEEVCTQEEIPCPHFNNTNDGFKQYCCKGFCMDLLKELARKINITYELLLSPDGQFGSYVIRNSSVGGKKEWTGLIGELVNQQADMIVAPLTINPERAEFIEFSKPFKYQGITILEKKPSRSSTLVSFLQPFSNTLWILVMVSVHVVALVLYLLDRFSPFGRFKLANTDGTEEDALNLSSAIWFAWGVLLNSGIGEGTPRSFSARVLGMVWAGFAMIIVASYTANLAAFLVLERPKTKLTGINDARLRNTMENLTCATVKNSAVDMYFRRQVELSNMYRTMEANNYDTAEEAIRDVKKGKLMAFIWDSSRLEFEAAQDCELVTAGELFGRSGYGIGLQKGSPWADAVTLAILDFHESGIMESLDNRWILQGNFQQCEQFEKTPNTLGLKNMAGVFILVAAGIVGGIGLIIIEMVYKKHQIHKQKRMELARHAADKWRGAIEKRKTLRATMAAQRRLKANGVNDPVTVSLSVDALSRHCMETRSPARAWPGGCDVRQRVPHTDEIRVATTTQSNLAYGAGLPDMIV